MNQPSAEMVACLLALKNNLEAAAHGESGRLVGEFAALHGCSKQTVWRWLALHAGYRSGRKQRSDTGTTRVDTKTLHYIAAFKGVSVRADGRATKPTAVAMNIADTNGLQVNVSASQMNRLLRARKLDVKTQANARNHGRLRAECPNAVHEIDPSLCLLYYMGNRQMMMTEAEFNKNKPAAMEKVKLKVWRYTRYDRASASIDVKYYEAAGENQASLFDFLLHTWGEQPQRLSHGVPKRLLWDKGSANTSSGIVKLLDALGVAHETHATHHAWVKGGVEKANHIVEMHFESRLREEPVHSVEELNAAAGRWVRDYNANQIKHVDCRVRRHDGERHVRDDLWQLILRYPGALVKMPERKVCAWYLTGRETTRNVRDNLISFVHPEIGKSRVYDLTQWAEFYSQNDKVKVMPLLLAEGVVRVEIARLGQEPLLVEVAPERDFNEFGDMMSAVQIGEEYRAAKLTVAERAARDIAHTAYGDVTLDEAEALLRKNVRPFQDFNGGQGIVSHSHLGQGELPERLLPKAKELELRAAETEQKRWSHARMAGWLRDRMQADWDPAITAELQKRWPEGATETEMELILADLQAGRSVDGRARLKAV
jgi:transposase InsO family protein